jgi:drug/metabolite transporter (DMT)-like permease
LFLILIFYLGWAAKNVVIEITLSDIEPLSLTLAVSLVTVLAAIPIVFVQNRRRGRRIWIWFDNRTIAAKLALVSCTTAVAMYTTILAIDLIGPFAYAVTDVIAYAISLSILSFLFLGEQINTAVVQATIISIAGFLIFNLGSDPESGTLRLLGILVAVTASVFWACSIILIKQLLNAGVSPEELVFFRFLLLAVLALVIIPGELANQSLAVLIQIILIGVFGYAILFMIFFYGLKDVAPPIVAVFVASGPLFTAIFTWLLIPGTSYTVIQLVGLGIIMFGLIYAMLRQRNGTPAGVAS